MRELLQADKIHPTIREQVQNYHSDIVAEVQKAVADNRIVFVGMR